jgi:type IV pilus assembly protein PilA
MKKERITNNKGFSLVELIVVIAIMAVLVGVLAPQFIKYVEKSRESTDVQNIEEVGTSIKTYFADEESTGTVTVTMSHASTPSVSVTGGLSVSGADTALSEAGLEGAKLKSPKWTNDAVEITLDVENGKITKSGQATYLKADGTK